MEEEEGVVYPGMSLTTSELKDSCGAWGVVAHPHLAVRNLTAAGGWMNNPGLTHSEVTIAHCERWLAGESTAGVG